MDASTGFWDRIADRYTRMNFIKLIAPIGKRLGVMPLVQCFTTEELVASLTQAGFEIDHQWQPGKGKAVFIVAKKPRV